MLDLIFAKLTDPQFMGAIATAVAVAAAIITVGLPLLERSELKDRMNAVAIERDRIRIRERERLNQGRGSTRTPASLRSEPKAYMKQIVEHFDLRKWLGTAKAKEKLVMAGYRGQGAETAFLFFRLVTPIALFLFALFYVFVAVKINYPPMVKLAIALFAGFIGIKGPEIFLSNQISKRQLSMRRAFPDALDLLLICVEAGMSIEHAFRKVSQEIGSTSVALAEELALVTAELSYLQERRQAYENLGKRTGLESIKAVCTALVQAERYGTPLGTALRVLAQESRDQRMTDAEKKAAALPPKLTVPMVIFFLPVLFIVIMTPALIQVFKWS